MRTAQVSGVSDGKLTCINEHLFTVQGKATREYEYCAAINKMKCRS
jgi:hypothetical protein